MYKSPRKNKVLKENFYTDNLIDDYKNYLNIYEGEYIEKDLNILEQKIQFKKDKSNSKYYSYYEPFKSNLQSVTKPNIWENNEKLKSKNVDIDEWINLKIDCEIKRKKMEEQQLKKIEIIYEKELMSCLKRKKWRNSN